MSPDNTPRCPHCRNLLTSDQAFCGHCGASVASAQGEVSLRDKLQALLGTDIVVEAELGRGAMGVVFAGFDTQLHRRIAVKVLHPDAAIDDAVAARFVREARVAAALDHPNVVSIHAVRQDESLRAIVMQRIEGRGLETLLGAQPPLPVPVVALIIAQVADALQHAHERGVIHRDVKPANVLIAPQGVAVVTDFGIARTLGGTRITEQGLVIGTIGYLAPEVCVGQDATPRSDQYALGVVAFELLCGRRPFVGSPADVLRMQATADAPDIEALRPDLPHALVRTVRRMLERDPDARWPSLREVAREFRSLVTDARRSTEELRAITGVHERTVSRTAFPSVAVPVKSTPPAQVVPPTAPSRPSTATRSASGMYAAAVLLAVSGVALAFWIVRDRGLPADAAATGTGGTPQPPAATSEVAPAAPPPASRTAVAPSRPPGPMAAPAADSHAPTPPRAGSDSIALLPRREASFGPPPARSDSAVVVAPPRDSATTRPSAPPVPAATAADARRLGNTFITMVNQGRWRELEALDGANGDGTVRAEVVALVRSTREIAAGFDRLPSSPLAAAGGFETEFIAELALGSAANAPRRYYVIVAIARPTDAGWVLAGWRAERAP